MQYMDNYANIETFGAIAARRVGSCLPVVAVDDVKVDAESDDESTAVNDELGRCWQRKDHGSDDQ